MALFNPIKKLDNFVSKVTKNYSSPTQKLQSGLNTLSGVVSKLPPTPITGLKEGATLTNLLTKSPETTLKGYTQPGDTSKGQLGAFPTTVSSYTQPGDMTKGQLGAFPSSGTTTATPTATTTATTTPTTSTGTTGGTTTSTMPGGGASDTTTGITDLGSLAPERRQAGSGGLTSQDLANMKVDPTLGQGPSGRPGNLNEILNASGTSSTMPAYLTDLQNLQNEYLKYLQPSELERLLKDEYADFVESANLGISQKEGQGRGIPLELIRGQQEKLFEQAEIQGQTLLQKIANATAERQAQIDALKAQLGFAGDLATMQQSEEQFQQQQALQQQQIDQQRNQPFEFDGNLVQFDPATGTLRTLAEGRVVNPGTDDMQEYQYALQTGFSGSFLDYLQAKSGGGGSGFSLSPGQTRYDQFGNIIAYNPEGGFGTGTGQLTDDQLKTLQSMPEFEALQLSDAFLPQLENYISLVEQYGRAGSLQPKQKQQLEAAYAELATSWKELKNLGALTGPDLDLIKQAIPDATQVGLFGWKNLGPDFFSTGTGQRILKTLNQSKDNVALDALKQYKRLMQQNPAYANSGYLSSYIQPFLSSEAITPEAVGQIMGVPNSEIQAARNAGFDDLTIKSMIVQPSFSSVGNDTNSVAIQAVKQKFPVGSSGGQCGRFVNNLTGLGVGDSFESKMAKTDPSIGTPYNPPRSGDVFVMPYSWTGHIGMIEQAIPRADGTYDLYVIDSNWGLDEKVQRHVLNSSQISGYARQPIRV